MTHNVNYCPSLLVKSALLIRLSIHLYSVHTFNTVQHNLLSIDQYFTGLYPITIHHTINEYNTQYRYKCTLNNNE
jgi:hypothetical protein